jgi:hypothetical protein
MAWNHNYRMLNKGEIILASDEVQNDDASWDPACCVGDEAPDPSYTSHRVYRRLTEAGHDHMANEARFDAEDAKRY